MKLILKNMNRIWDQHAIKAILLLILAFYFISCRNDFAKNKMIAAEQTHIDDGISIGSPTEKPELSEIANLGTFICDVIWGSGNDGITDTVFLNLDFYNLLSENQKKTIIECKPSIKFKDKYTYVITSHVLSCYVVKKESFDYRIVKIFLAVSEMSAPLMGITKHYKLTKVAEGKYEVDNKVVNFKLH
jgi:hypothetical protein